MAKILVVDDEEPLAVMLRDCLISEGYDVVVCCDATAAEGVALTEKPDLAIIDYKMPLKTGVQLLADLRAREETRQLPVLFLSGTQALRFAPQVPSDPRVRFCSKPLELGVLLVLIGEMLDPNGWSTPR